MTDNRKLLKDVLDYGTKHGTWSKRLFTRNADIVCAYGMGKYFSDAFCQFGFQEAFNVQYCSDTNTPPITAKKIATEYNLQYIDPTKLREMNKTKTVVLVLFVGNGLKLAKELRQEGFLVFDPVELIFEKLCDMPDDLAWFQKNRALETIDILADDESKSIYANVFAQRMAQPLAYRSYEEMRSDDAYFYPSFFPLTGEEVFCDCGAFDGDTLEDFLKATKGKCKYIYAYEMADENFVELTKKTLWAEQAYKDFSATKYRLFHAGVWNKIDVISYGKEDKGPKESYGVFKKENQYQVAGVTIDETVDLPTTFIKMDIEGAEMNALMGAKKQIQQNRPKLAICIYHRLQDLWEIPMYIKSLVPEYKFYVRHHTTSIGDTVLYAVC